MILKKLKEGITVYDVRHTTGLNRFNSKWSTYPVYVKEIDEQEEMVFASWNGNKGQWFNKNTWSKWRLKTPTL